MGLALIHHLCIGKNLSLNHVGEMFAQLSSKYVIVEFIPKEDNKVNLLLESREDIFENYKEEYFKSNFSSYFKLIAEVKINSSLRKLYLWEIK